LISGADITPSVVDAYQAAGMHVSLIQRLEEIPFADAEFDVVYMMQVLEHIARPNDLLQEVNRVLKPAGVLYVAVPNAKSPWRRIFGKYWVAGWFAPYHVFAYSQQPISVLAAAHGFEVAQSWSSTPESWLRLNMKAWLHRSNNRLDFLVGSWVDYLPVRMALAVALRLTEAFTTERDCLVLALKKISPQC